MDILPNQDQTERNDAVRFCRRRKSRHRDKSYTDRFAGILAEYGIQCGLDVPEHFEINDFVLPASVRD